MKVWFATNDVDAPYGVYIADNSRNRAKSIAAHEMGCDYVDVQITSMRVDSDMDGLLSKNEIKRLFGEHPEL